MLVLGLLIGAALGGIATGADGLLWGAALGGVLGHLLAARKQPSALEARIAALEAKVAALEAGPARTSAELAEIAEVAEPRPVAVPLPPAPTLPPTVEPPASADWPDSEPDDPPAAPPPKPSHPTVEMPAWAQRIWAANTIVKLGLGILFLGLAFLARYAAERVTLPIELRLTGIAAVGLLLLGFGWRLRLRRPAYGLALQGGGVAVLYLVLFAGAKVFGLLGLLPAFALMVLIAGFAALLAVLQNAQALAVLGSLGRLCHAAAAVQRRRAVHAARRLLPGAGPGRGRHRLGQAVAAAEPDGLQLQRAAGLGLGRPDRAAGAFTCRPRPS